MWNIIQQLLFLAGYVLAAYLIIKFSSKFIAGINPYLRLLIISFLYALFWGIGVAGSDGDPGFAFPVPNIIAIALMIGIDFYKGVITGLYILAAWWAIIFLVMLIRHFIKRRKQVQPN